jgi:hypothetical protein
LNDSATTAIATSRCKACCSVCSVGSISSQRPVGAQVLGETRLSGSVHVCVLLCTVLCLMYSVQFASHRHSVSRLKLPHGWCTRNTTEEVSVAVSAAASTSGRHFSGAEILHFERGHNPLLHTCVVDLLHSQHRERCFVLLFNDLLSSALQLAECCRLLCPRPLLLSQRCSAISASRPRIKRDARL